MPTAIDETKLNQFIGQMLGDLGGALSVAMVRIGARFGLYEALHARGPMTSAELAQDRGIAERYAREWLSQQAASGYLAYDPVTTRFTLPPEQALVFAVQDSPVYLVDGFNLAAAALENQAKVEAAFVSGAGVDWGHQGACLFCAVGRFYRPGYVNNLVPTWLPALEGVIAKLERGARVADLGCGHGYSTALMARAFPNSEFVGYDFHPDSIAQAAAHAAEHDLGGNTRFEVATAKNFAGRDFDLITCFDCLHDMGDPAGAAGHVFEALRPDGTWMVVEPNAADRLEDNLNPVGRLYYAGSTMVCLPTSLAQEVGAALGAQAGFARLSDVIGSGGFTRIRRAATTPFNMVIEARR